jgi:hypothetical protein
VLSGAKHGLAHVDGLRKLLCYERKCEGSSLFTDTRLSEDHAEGAHAYGSEHAAMHEALITRCKIVWARKNKFTTQFTEAIPEASNDQASDVPVDDTVYEYNEDIV